MSPAITTPERGKPLIGYIRVSTDQQHNSGLGEAAQLTALEAYAARQGTTFLRIFREVETGKRRDLANRPQLQAAIAMCELSRGVLVIAKLDRLMRNVHVMSGLMESGLDFVALDAPNANRLTIHILAAVAEDEARRVSQRTRDALTAKKAQGVKLGCALPQCRANLSTAGRRLGQLRSGAASRDRATRDARGVAEIARPMRQNGATLQEIADHLNRENYPTRSGHQWLATTVRRVLDRAGRASQRV